MKTEHLVRRLADGDDGQDLVEYSLLASLIAIGAMGALSALGTQVAALWNG
jgi:Flp pilus assembly pilin Flp